MVLSKIKDFVVITVSPMSLCNFRVVFFWKINETTNYANLREKKLFVFWIDL